MDDNQIRMEQLIQGGKHKGPAIPWPEIPEKLNLTLMGDMLQSRIDISYTSR
jgi:hypothetical protein